MAGVITSFMAIRSAGLDSRAFPAQTLVSEVIGALKREFDPVHLVGVDDERSGIEPRLKIDGNPSAEPKILRSRDQQ